MGVVSCLSVIRGSFAQTWSVWEHEACTLSGIKKVRSWEVVSVYIYLDSDFNPYHSYSIAIVSFIERLSSGGRVRYGRFHCIAFYVSLDYTSTVSRLALHVLTVIANSANFTRFSP